MLEKGDRVIFENVKGDATTRKHATVLSVHLGGIPSCKEPMVNITGVAGLVLMSHCQKIEVKEVFTKIGQLLKIYMAWRCVGVRELAGDIGVSTATVSRLTRGEKADLETYFKINKWLWHS